jgi:hypothetical protein
VGCDLVAAPQLEEFFNQWCRTKAEVSTVVRALRCERLYRGFGALAFSNAREKLAVSWHAGSETGAPFLRLTPAGGPMRMRQFDRQTMIPIMVGCATSPGERADEFSSGNWFQCGNGMRLVGIAGLRRDSTQLLSVGLRHAAVGVGGGCRRSGEAD